MPASRFILAVVAAVSIGFFGCAGPQPAEAPQPTPEEAPEPAPPTGPRHAMVAFGPQGLFRADDPGGELRVLTPDAEPGGLALPSPDRQWVAFSFRRADSVHLAVTHVIDGRVHMIHGEPDDALYSAAWSPTSDRLAFGFRTDGAGDVMIWNDEGLTDPGCSASTLVAHWPQPSRLVTGDAANRYVVSTEDCETRAALDVRKMHHIHYAPGRSRMAYIFRDLVYDRPTRAYVPDSTLFVADLDGSNADDLFDDAYEPRHITWSPDGRTLAFDILLQEPPNRRRIVLKDDGAGFTYLVPPDDFPNADVVRPLFSPSGDHVAFDLRSDAGLSKGVRTFGRTQVFDVDADSTWGWIDDETIAFVTPDDSLRAFSLDGQVRFTLPPSVNLLSARRIMTTQR